MKVQCWGPVWSEKVGVGWISNRSVWLLELLTELIKRKGVNDLFFFRFCRRTGFSATLTLCQKQWGETERYLRAPRVQKTRMERPERFLPIFYFPPTRSLWSWSGLPLQTDHLPAFHGIHRCPRRQPCRSAVPIVAIIGDIAIESFILWGTGKENESQ